MGYEKDSCEEYSHKPRQKVFFLLDEFLKTKYPQKVDENNFLKPESSYPGGRVVENLEGREEEMNIIS